jgi:hypothetical protein
MKNKKAIALADDALNAYYDAHKDYESVCGCTGCVLTRKLWSKNGWVLSPTGHWYKEVHE